MQRHRLPNRLERQFRQVKNNRFVTEFTGSKGMITVLRTVLYVCCMAVALTGGVAAVTIVFAVALNKIPSSPDSWMSAAFFVIAGGLALIAGRALERDPSSVWFGDD